MISLLACRSLVWHRVGRGYDTTPVIRAEAAARRAQRFTRDGHSPHPVVPRAANRDPDAPYTFDLRKYSGDRPAPEPEVESEE
jgi:uncharacterized protein (DUF2126 family)